MILLDRTKIRVNFILVRDKYRESQFGS